MSALSPHLPLAERGDEAFFRLLYDTVSEANDGPELEALEDVAFDGDGRGVEAEDGGGADADEHGG